MGGFVVTWPCTTFTGGVKVPPNVQRNINGKPAPQKRRRQPPCRALRCSVLAPSFGASLDLDWPELEPDCPGRPTDKQQHSTAQPGQGRSRQLTTPTGTLFFCPGFLQDWTYSIINPSVHSPPHPPPTLWPLSSQGTDQANPVHTFTTTTEHSVRCCLPSPRLLSNFSSRPSLLCRCSSSSSSSFPSPRLPLPAVPQLALGVTRRLGHDHRRDTWVFCFAL